MSDEIQALIDKFRRADIRYGEQNAQMLPQFSGFRKEYIDELAEPELPVTAPQLPNYCAGDEEKTELLRLVRRNLFDRAFNHLINHLRWDLCQYDPQHDCGRYDAYRALSSSDEEAECRLRADMKVIGKMVKKFYAIAQQKFVEEIPKAEEREFAAMVRRQVLRKQNRFSPN